MQLGSLFASRSSIFKMQTSSIFSTSFIIFNAKFINFDTNRYVSNGLFVSVKIVVIYPNQSKNNRKNNRNQVDQSKVAPIRGSVSCQN